MSYTRTTTVDGDFESVVESTVDALADEGFGVLADIDVQATFESKLDVEFRNYRILGACNPPLAHEGVSTDIELGALLPCNVVVYENDEGEVTVAVVDPGTLVGVADDPALDDIASQVDERFDRVLDVVGGMTD